MEHELDQQRLGESIDRLYRAAWALCGSKHDADDLVQETYARVLSRPRIIRRETDIAYLLRALRNTFITQREKQERTIPVDSEALAAEPDPNTGTQPEVAFETAEVFRRIAALSPRHRDVVVAVDVAGLSYKEAARALRIPRGTVMSRLYRARDRIAAELSDGGAPADRSEGGAPASRDGSLPRATGSGDGHGALSAEHRAEAARTVRRE